MLTYNLIIKKIMNLDEKKNIFSFNYVKNDNIDEIFKIFFIGLLNDNNFIKNKFNKINEVMNNFYFSTKTDKKNEFSNLFFKIQRTYHILNNFVYSYKYKRAKIMINTDLQLNEININDNNVICIYHINCKYLFKIEDLLKIIYTCLTNNSFSFFCEPISIKNPYNNLPFGKSILYYIYFFITSKLNIQFLKEKYIDLFLKFKECNFNMTKFLNNFEYLLREYVIENYINNSTEDILRNIINQIIYEFNSNVKNNKRKIYISDEFPDKELINIFKPYIHLKLISLYSLIKQKKRESKQKLYRKLYDFQEYNPKFGRKIIKFKNIIRNGRIKRIKSHTEFNMNHKKFNTYEIENFMNNHLIYKYDHYNEDNNESEDEDEIQEQNQIYLIMESLSNNRIRSNLNSYIYQEIYYNHEEQQQDEEQKQEEDEEEDEEEEQEIQNYEEELTVLYYDSEVDEQDSIS